MASLPARCLCRQKHLPKTHSRSRTPRPSYHTPRACSKSPAGSSWQCSQSPECMPDNRSVAQTYTEADVRRLRHGGLHPAIHPAQVSSSAIGSRPNLPRRQAPRGVIKTAIPQTRIAGRLNSIAGQISSMESLHAHNHNNSPRPPPAITITTSRPSDMPGNPIPYCTHLRHLL